MSFIPKSAQWLVMAGTSPAVTVVGAFDHRR